MEDVRLDGQTKEYLERIAEALEKICDHLGYINGNLERLDEIGGIGMRLLEAINEITNALEEK